MWILFGDKKAAMLNLDQISLVELRQGKEGRVLVVALQPGGFRDVEYPLFSGTGEECRKYLDDLYNDLSSSSLGKDNR